MEGLLVQVHLPQIKEGVVPRKRFMSAFEQKKEAPNKNYQYLIVRPTLALHMASPSELISLIGCRRALRNSCLPNTCPGNTRRDR